MTQLIPISKNTYTGKSWTKSSSYHFASKDNLVLLAGVEISKAVTSLPMAFAKQQGHFFMVAVMSLVSGTNLFVSPDGRWLGEYIPAVFRGYPFQLAKAEGADDMLLCVNEASGLVKDDKTAGEPFFEASGELAPPVKEILQFLTGMEQNREVTNRAVASLAQAGIIAQWPLKIKDGEHEKPVTGLYRIDEAKLKSLEDEAFVKLRNALPIAYAQLLSMNNLQKFERLAKAREQMKAKKDPGMKAILGDDDIISFQ